jgi:hypothetical protein
MSLSPIGGGLSKQARMIKNICSEDEMRTSYINQLNVKIQALNNIHELPYPQQRIEFGGFMQSIGKLFLNYFHQDLQAAHQCAEGNKKTLESVGALARRYVSDTESMTHKGFEYGGEWEAICIERTYIEAFNAMFGKLVEPLDTADLEESMQDVKDEASYPEGVPKNVPESHWWWFV